MKRSIRLAPQSVAQAVLNACRMDVLAFKPGNVSLASPGHGMSAEDFLVSAECVAAAMTDHHASVGARILTSIQATWTAVGCNTNLGIVLLCAPLVHAALAPDPDASLAARLRRVLATLSVDDARQAFAAIRLAKPAGLGSSAAHDVHDEPAITLLDAMHVAAERDRVAYQYAHDYSDIFGLGVLGLREHQARWAHVSEPLHWAAVACYLGFMSCFPDSHVQRKFGADIANSALAAAKKVETSFKACENPANAMPLLQQLDNKFKREGINPGTSADLTVASLLAFHLENLLRTSYTTSRIHPAGGLTN